MVEIPLSQDAWELAAAQPAPTADPYGGVPLGMEAFIAFLAHEGNPG